jgi:hypothetical protein
VGRGSFAIKLGPDGLIESRRDVADGQFKELEIDQTDDAVALCRLVAPPDKAATCTKDRLDKQPVS